MEGASQGPQINRSKPPLTLDYLARLNKHDAVVKVLRMLLANGELADYDDELANRVHDAIEIVEGVTLLNDSSMVESASDEVDSDEREKGIVYSAGGDDKRLFRANMQRARADASIYAFRVSREHYLWLGQQIEALKA